MNSPLLRYALLAGAVYFCCMAVAHFFGIKLPLLFVYYDTPFYAYQDKIISFAVVSYIALFYSAAQHRVVVPAALVVLGATVLGLASVNGSDALASVYLTAAFYHRIWKSRVIIAWHSPTASDLTPYDAKLNSTQNNSHKKLSKGTPIFPNAHLNKTCIWTKTCSNMVIRVF